MIAVITSKLSAQLLALPRTLDEIEREHRQWEARIEAGLRTAGDRSRPMFDNAFELINARRRCALGWL